VRVCESGVEPHRFTVGSVGRDWASARLCCFPRELLSHLCHRCLPLPVPVLCCSTRESCSFTATHFMMSVCTPIRPHRFLLLTASPTDLSPVAADQHALAESLQRLTASEDASTVRFFSKPFAKPPDITRRLASSRPRVLHVCAHMNQRQGDKVGIALNEEHPGGEPMLLTGETLAAILNAHNGNLGEEDRVQCVLLTGCCSAVFVHPLLVVVNHVIATADRITPEQVRVYSEGWYHSILHHHTVRYAHDMALQELKRTFANITFVLETKAGVRDVAIVPEPPAMPDPNSSTDSQYHLLLCPPGGNITRELHELIGPIRGDRQAEERFPMKRANDDRVVRYRCTMNPLSNEAAAGLITAIKTRNDAFSPLAVFKDSANWKFYVLFNSGVMENDEEYLGFAKHGGCAVLSAANKDTALLDDSVTIVAYYVNRPIWPLSLDRKLQGDPDCKAVCLIPSISGCSSTVNNLWHWMIEMKGSALSLAQAGVLSGRFLFQLILRVKKIRGKNARQQVHMAGEEKSFEYYTQEVDHAALTSLLSAEVLAIRPTRCPMCKTTPLQSIWFENFDADNPGSRRRCATCKKIVSENI
jgi:hypothetical protein